MRTKHGAFSLWTLLGRTSAVALAVGLGAGAAVGQKAFQGSYTPNPDVYISQGSSPGNDAISLNSTQAVIDWTPDDRGAASAGTIDFLPQGRTVTFSSSSDFTVLNRILPLDGNGLPVSRVIALNGTVQSQIVGSPPTTGGSVWFYAPGGIIAGANSVFNVGSLVLTTNAIDTSNGLDRNNIRFAGPAGSTSSVELLPGAQVNALSSGSYVALVAPRVVQGGTVNVNGSAAYVAAEAADIRINNGLFDIAITAGTTDANGVVHSGTTTGPASTGGTDLQRVFMVAVPKNNALTMLLSGNVGYTPATSVTPDGSAIVLSAGSDIAHDAGGNLIVTRNATATAAAGFSIGSGDWQNDVTGAATGDIVIRPATVTHFLGNVALSAERSITLQADQSGTITVDRDMNLKAGNGGTGGRIDLLAFGGSGAPSTNGQIGVTGTLNLDASGDGEAGVSSVPLVGGDANGGIINLIATGGSITAASLTANAVGYAGYGSDRSGNATGGSITLSALTAAGPSGTEGGSLGFGSTTLDASAGTAFQVSVPPVDGGDAIGGSIAINGTSGAFIQGGLDLGTVRATAQATGGIASTGAAGSATSGDIRVAISAGRHDWTSFFADVSTAPGYATDGGSYGAAIPGATGIDIDVGGTGSLNILTSVSLYADATAYGGGASGGTLRGGRINISAHDGGGLAIAQDLFATADASGFAAFAGSTFLTPRTADALGGSITIGAAGGSFSAAGLYVSAGGFAGDAPGLAGSGTGGNVALFASASSGQRGSFSLSDCPNYSCRISANGGGASGANGSNGTGGSVLLYASDGDFSALGDMTLQANGIGSSAASDGVAGRGGDGLGGSILVENRVGSAGDGALRFGNLYLSAEGASAPPIDGITFNGGDAGNGTGGTINVNILAGSLTADLVDARANGSGGAAGENCLICEGGGTTSFRAGNGQGGTADFLIAGGGATLGTLLLSAQGTGGEADGANSPSSAAAIAGAGLGGNAALQSRGGTLGLTTLAIDAGGTGGMGYPVFQADGVDGGTGTGGTAGLLLAAGSSGAVTITGPALVRATGKGGDGAETGADGAGFYRAGAGGLGTGGTADVTAAGGVLTAPSLLISAEGIGGAGGNNGSDGPGAAAGDGLGGTAAFSYLNEGHAIGTVTVDADGIGGQAGNSGFSSFDNNGNPIFFYGTTGGGAGGRGTGGSAAMLVDVDPLFANLTVSADGIGSMGGGGGTGGAGGVGMGGAATLDLSFGATTVSGTLRVTAAGLGGTGGTGYDGSGGRGGDAFGGSASLGLTGASTLLDAGDIGVLAEAIGGAGGQSGVRSGTGLLGADGGNATGGAALFTLGSGATATTGLALRISGDATGGDGALGTAGPVGGNGGAGGNGLAGSATLRIADARIVLGGALPQMPAYSITANGQGGLGADGSVGSNAGLSGGLGGNGGNGAGGLAAFDSSNGDYVLGGMTLRADGQGGLGGIGGKAPGGASAAGVTGLGSGGTASFANRDDGLLSPGAQRLIDALLMSASGDASGLVSLTDGSTATNGGLRVTGSARLSSLGIPTAGFSGVSVGATNIVRIGGNADFVSDGPLSFAFAGAGDIMATGALTGVSGTRIDFSHVGRPQGSDSLFADSILFTAPGNITMSSAGSLRAVNDLTILSAAGNINLAAGSVLTAGGNLTLSAQGINAASLVAGGQSLLDAGAGSLVVSDIASAGPITASGGAVSLGATGGMTIAQATASTGALLLNAGGALSIADASAATGMTLSGGLINATRLSAGDSLTATAASSAILGDVISLAGDILLNGGGLLTLTGSASARTITIGSRDIVLGGSAQLGSVNGTSQVVFNAINLQQPAYIGGNDVAGTYSLSAAELARVTATQIAFNAPARSVAGSPDIIVQDLTLGAANLASGGMLTIGTSGHLRVQGAVRLIGRSGQGGLALTAGRRLEIIAGAGLIDISDGNGALGGVLTLDSPIIMAASLSAIADIGSTGSITARDLRLAQNDGPVDDAGILRAGTIRANASQAFFIQNSGLSVAIPDRRGFTANNLVIGSQGPALQIAINGRLALSTGAFAQGLETIPLVAVNGGYALGSRINGCLIGSPAACTSVSFDSRDTWNGVLDPSVSVSRIFTLSLIELRDIVAQGYPPLIDEPVTGAGNEDLWERSCGGPDEAGCGDGGAH